MSELIPNIPILAVLNSFSLELKSPIVISLTSSIEIIHSVSNPEKGEGRLVLPLNAFSVINISAGKS